MWAPDSADFKMAGYGQAQQMTLPPPMNVSYVDKLSPIEYR